MRLISFVGTGNYSETTYSLEGETCRTRYVTHALATFLRPTSIQLIATTEAWAQHGASLSDVLSASGHPSPTVIPVQTGGAPEQLWDMFGRIVEAIRTAQAVLVDITHGFRMQPFFAAACLQYVQAVVPNPPEVRVMYGEFRAAEPLSPIWELTPFIDVLSWSRSLMLFLKTGNADAVVAPTEQLGRQLSRQWAASGRQGSPPQLRNLANAIRAFSNDFTTVRTGSLLMGNRSSANQLCTTIDQARDEVTQHMPTLTLILDQLQAMTRPLVTEERLSTPTGQQSLLALARLYQQMGRYSEAISILREGWITLAASPTADNPGIPTFSAESREAQERSWQMQTTQSRTVSEMRNDIQHAGFNKQPHDREWFERQLTTLLDQWQSAIETSHSDKTE